MTIIKKNKWLAAYALSALAFVAGVIGVRTNAPRNPFPIAVHMAVTNIINNAPVFVYMIAAAILIAVATTVYLIVRRAVRLDR
jgi:hypothetical protein